MANPRVLCDAVAFGYGPIGKLLSIRACLPAEWTFTLAATSGTLQLARISGFDRILECDTESKSDLAAHRSEFASADLFLNIMNPESAAFACDLRVSMAVVDSLFWMWDSLPDSLAAADTYFIQRFAGVQDRLAIHAPVHPLLVGAIIDRSAGPVQKANQLLINLGGLKSRLIQPGVNSNYASVLASLLARVLDQGHFDRILLTGESDTMKVLAREVRTPRISFVTLGHKAFLQELSASRLLITSPGLTTTYEAFAASVPTVFLPPQNFSQFLILARLQAAGVAPYGLHWRDLYPDADVRIGESEPAGVATVLECIRRFEGDAASQAQFLHTYTAALEADTDVALVERQHGFVQSVGADGASEVSARIREMV
jgi:hypothetical protein